MGTATRKNIFSKLYSVTIDRSKFREVASRIVVFVVPLFFIGQELYLPGIGLALIGLFVRAWGAGYLKKDKELAQGGPYLLFRHPLYFGSCMLALSFIVVLHHWAVFLIIGGVTFLTYWHTIQHEEKNLNKHFGKAYKDYSKRVGPLWPKPKGLKYVLKNPSKLGGFSIKQFMKNKEWECILGVVAVFGILWAGKHFLT